MKTLWLYKLGAALWFLAAVVFALAQAWFSATCCFAVGAGMVAALPWTARRV